MTCVLCPNGCTLTVEGERVSGCRCSRGREFAVKELTDPERMLTTTVKVRGRRELAAVRSDRPVKKAELPGLVRRLSVLEVEPPLRAGQILLDGVGENRVAILVTGETPE